MFHKATYYFVLGVHGTVTSIQLMFYSFFIFKYCISYTTVVLNNTLCAISAVITNYVCQILNLLSTLTGLLSFSKL